MKQVMKTPKKIVFEATKKEIEKSGFDSIWDSIRKEYPENEYDIFTVEEDKKGSGVVFFELSPKI